MPIPTHIRLILLKVVRVWVEHWRRGALRPVTEKERKENRKQRTERETGEERGESTDETTTLSPGEWSPHNSFHEERDTTVRRVWGAEKTRGRRQRRKEEKM